MMSKNQILYLRGLFIKIVCTEYKTIKNKKRVYKMQIRMYYAFAT